MVVRKEDLHNLIERLTEPDQKIVFDFLQNLIDRSNHKSLSWDEIDKLQPDDEPLSQEALQQLNSTAGYVSGEAAKREFRLHVDLP